MKHHKIEANGISLHFVELGKGPAVLFSHGFPAIWSSWRAQMEAVANAGFRAIALDMRGYGASSAPHETEDYTPSWKADHAAIRVPDFDAAVAW
jgi:pimeloyl-ACP methyl ester carboxylesterase